MKQAVYLILAVCFSGCVSSTKQTDLLLANPLSIPAQHHIADAPFINQEAGHCGPATLAMAMNSLGQSITADELASHAFTPGAKGTFQSDMIGAARRQGLLALPITGMENLLQEVAANNPVIVFENLALKWIPQWHYALVIGYDLKRRHIVMHSGPEAFKEWDLRKFERSWKLADYWGLVILRPDQLSPTANELTHLNGASALEQIGKTTEAATVYKTILSKWPQSLVALIGLGNIHFARHEFEKAIFFLRQATETHPNSAAAWHNRAIVEKSLKQKSAARVSAKKALEKAALESAELFNQYKLSLSQIF
ncbi:MAG: hypothetical protein A2622_13645 [Bdellovibrionales bacterium RIFCSPHIGHO2_01_FULL_40_29]|nr:MAG: hypothetical protein A2622_13645 [Bdellovibrionales bacterium RIFCSPHIGHO2_01_FULL_40_29]OFZ34261.1 MAG: hypothetical protein A3D17_04305 [Bdellovibrionales bacterium RIFCSPHIGHO2_02_FULL_40_15]